MAKRPRPFGNYGAKRLAGRFAGAVAKPVYVCARPGCEVHHKARYDNALEKWVAPDRCIACGGMEFDYFATTEEANRWAELRLQEKVKAISKLRRQVRIGLFTIAPNGLQAWVADYIADFVYERDGEEVIEDHKPGAGMDDVAKLKLKWVAAQRGKPVLIHVSAR